MLFGHKGEASVGRAVHDCDAGRVHEGPVGGRPYTGLGSDVDRGEGRPLPVTP